MEARRGGTHWSLCKAQTYRPTMMAPAGMHATTSKRSLLSTYCTAPPCAHTVRSNMIVMHGRGHGHGHLRPCMRPCWSRMTNDLWRPEHTSSPSSEVCGLHPCHGSSKAYARKCTCTCTCTCACGRPQGDRQSGSCAQRVWHFLGSSCAVSTASTRHRAALLCASPEAP